jgi:hypothetical protein
MYNEIRFDEKDFELLQERIAARNKLPGFLVGDFLLFDDGTYGRISHVWGDGNQWSRHGSFYFSCNGFASFSGGLNPPIDNDRFELMEETKNGKFWFFHHGFSGAHRGVQCEAPCKVYRVTGEYVEFSLS